MLETRQFVQVGRQAAFLSAFRPTALVIDLRRFPDCAAYMAAVGRETKGKYRRSANKAKRLGYHVRRIDPRSFPDSTRQIWSSKLIRSRGPVLEALLKREAASKDIELPLAEVPCHQHWVAGWGVFIDRDGKTRMVARAILRRAGNVVSIDQFMGHGDLLGDGVTKLLMFAIMQWILDRKDPSAQGLEYCFQGAIEDGSKGLVNWKRYTQFEPRACETDDQGVFRFPEGFDPRVYLELNPDVRAAGIDPKRHYLRHGLDEGRPYLR